MLPTQVVVMGSTEFNDYQPMYGHILEKHEREVVGGNNRLLGMTCGAKSCFLMHGVLLLIGK